MLVSSSVVSIGGAQSRSPASPISAGIADKVILGKEISKSVRCFQKHKRFGFMTFLHCEKKLLFLIHFEDVLTLSTERKYI